MPGPCDITAPLWWVPPLPTFLEVGITLTPTPNIALWGVHSGGLEPKCSRYGDTLIVYFGPLRKWAMVWSVPHGWKVKLAVRKPNSWLGKESLPIVFSRQSDHLLTAMHLNGPRQSLVEAHNKTGTSLGLFVLSLSWVISISRAAQIASGWVVGAMGMKPVESPLCFSFSEATSFRPAERR